MERKLTQISAQYFLLRSYILYALQNAFLPFYVNLYISLFIYIIYIFIFYSCQPEVKQIMYYLSLQIIPVKSLASIFHNFYS